MATGIGGVFGRRGGTRRALARLWRRLRQDPAALDPLASDERPSAAFEATWRPALKGRVLVVVALCGCWVVGIQARLVQLQVFQHDWLAEEARTKQQRVLKPEAPRGDIVDRHGRMLAYSVEAHGVYADPKLVTDPAATLAAVCAALGDCSARERRELAAQLDSPRRYVRIRRPQELSPEQARRVEALDLPGIALEVGSHRYYPGVELAAHVLGHVGMDNDGLAGIEFANNDVVRGQPGLAIAHVDAKRQRLATRVERGPVPGARLELTIDLALQHIVERELRRGVLENRAESGTAVVMNPMTGEILAMASYPTFDPNRPRQATDDDRRNRAVQDTYEPGSTFKIVTAAAALEHGLVKPSDLIDCSPGFISLPGRRPIPEAGGHNYGVISFEDVIVKSSNVGAIRVGLRTGAERLVDYVERFGFGQRHLRDLAGGTPGIWNPAGLNDSGVASVSMGYQIGVTPVQMAAAASVVANGGQLMRPRLVRAVERNGEREVRQPEVLRRVIRPETAATLTAIMEAVTERGTARTAKLDRYQVAGKTGTAKQVVDGRYSDTDYNASFVGFVPSRRPAFTILIVIDRPRSGSHYGGAVAAPVFKRIAEAALRQWGVPPTIDPLPPVILADDREPTVRRPAAPAIIPASVPLGGQALMPDVRGLSLRTAVRTLADAGLETSVSGSGLVVDQTPAPGEPIAPATWGAIRLDRRGQERTTRGDGR